MSSITGKRMKERRKELGMSAEEVAKFLGVSPATVYRYERGDIEKLPGTVLGPLSEILRTTPNYLMGWSDDVSGTSSVSSLPAASNIIPMPETYTVPVLGKIACGTPILAQENLDGFAQVPKNIKADFALVCQGDSMVDAGIRDQDIVYIRQQPTVDNGQIAAVLVDGECATLKRFFFEGGVVTLMAANQNYPPITKSGADVAEIQVLGLAVAYTHPLV